MDTGDGRVGGLQGKWTLATEGGGGVTRLVDTGDGRGEGVTR